MTECGSCTEYLRARYREPLWPHSQIALFEPLVKQHPENLPLALTLGQALVHFGRCDEGLELLRDALRCHPESSEAWDTWLSASPPQSPRSTRWPKSSVISHRCRLPLTLVLPRVIVEGMVPF